MQTLFFTLIAFVAIIVLMSVGFIFKKQSLNAGDENAKAEYEQKFAKKDDDSQFYEVK